MDSQGCTIQWISFPTAIDIRMIGCHVPDSHGHGRLFESRVDVVDRNRIERVRRVATDIDDHPQPTSRTRSIDLLMRYERWYLRGQVDAIDKDVNVQDLLEWTTLGGLIHVPLEDIVSTWFSDIHACTSNKGTSTLTLPAPPS